NDLDTLLANYLIHLLRKTPLVYDSHEFFTETPEVIHRPLVRGIWLTIERSILPRLEIMITVNQSLADIFHHKYKIPVVSSRNVPELKPLEVKTDRTSLSLPDDKNILILQGSGINIHRGAEELIASLRFLDNVLLLIIGGGDVMPQLKIMAKNLHVNDKIQFFDRMPAEELQNYTMMADIGLSIDKDICPNYHFSLPNKLFDYIHAGLPVLASPLPEIRKIVEHYQVGRIIHGHEPEILANDIQSMLDDKAALNFYRHNCLKARDKLNWENEKQILIPIYAKYLE
ncbi:MAG TPA: glycosyltransferase, partial [Bacteroidales bacterium]|nr:glycosyltransferase [Bacteroidales bacterium]